MLRITVQHDNQRLLLKLEGDLVDPWVGELNAVWGHAGALGGARDVRVDLRGIRRVDAAGKDAMSIMYLAGARLITGGCVMPEIVREISEEAGQHAGPKECTCSGSATLQPS